MVLTINWMHLTAAVLFLLLIEMYGLRSPLGRRVGTYSYKVLRVAQPTTSYIDRHSFNFSTTANREGHIPGTNSQIASSYTTSKNYSGSSAVSQFSPSDGSVAATSSLRFNNNGSSNSSASPLTLLSHVKRRRYKDAMRTYDIMVENGLNIKANLLHAMLSICTEAEHLPRALQLVDALQEAGVPAQSETAYIALIRCYSAALNVPKATSLLDQLLALSGVEPKLRMFQPLLEALCRTHDVQGALGLARRVKDLGLPLRGEQLTVLVELFGKSHCSGALLDAATRRALDALISEAGNTVIGLSTADMQRIAMAMNNLSRVDDLRQQGILVHALSDICGPILDSSNFTADCSVIALNATYDSSTSYGLSLEHSSPSQVGNNPMIPVGQDARTVQFAPEKYVVLSANESLKMLAENKQLLHNGSVDSAVLTALSKNATIADSETTTTYQSIQVGSSLLDLYNKANATRNYAGFQSVQQTVAGSSSISPAFSPSSTEEVPPGGIGGTHQQQQRQEPSPSSRRPRALPLSHIKCNSKEEKGRSRPLRLPPAPRRLQPARLVEISSGSCRCPNCGGEVRPLQLTQEEESRVRHAIQTSAAQQSLEQSNSLEEFADWLRSQEEGFEYIVDGANVAYFNQNFRTGKFSFKQIELVVEKLKERSRRILVVLPHCYTQKVMPNSIRQRRTRRGSVQQSIDDLRILNKLEEEGMLYVVPPGANDDWYWMYSTIYEGKKETQHTYVVSNDLMRDHKISFMEPKPFVRWRSSRIVYFGLSRPPHPLSHCLQQHQQHQQLQPQNSAAVSVPVPVPASVPEAIASSISENPALINTSALLDAGIDVGINKDTEFASFGQQHGSAAVQEGDMSNVLRPAGRTLTSPEVYFYGPGKFSREIQQSPSNGRWHIPSTDRSVWLCLSTEPQL